MKTHYEILGLSESAAQDEIKKAYFELARKYHPDSGELSEVKKFHELAEAYKTLSDKELRQAYDETLKVGMERINTIEEEMVQNTPSDPQMNRQVREDYRDEELDAFYKSRFRRALFKVIVFSLMAYFLGVVVAWFLDIPTVFSGVAAFFMGSSFSMQKHFDLQSFFKDAVSYRRFRFLLWILITLGILYFVTVGIFSMLGVDGRRMVYEWLLSRHFD